MFIVQRVFFILIILIFSNCDDCYYDDTTNHVEYVCGVAEETNFRRNSYEHLYCNNHASAINRGVIEVLSLRGCTSGSIDYDFFYAYTGLRIFNISSVELRNLYASNFLYHKYVEQIIASHNYLSKIREDLFSNTPVLTSVDFSYNQITQLIWSVFDNVRRLTSINFSFNKIRELDERLFRNLQDLKYLDFSNNQIKRIESNSFVNNQMLMELHLNDNQVNRLECTLLSTLAELSSLSITLNTLENLEMTCVTDNKHINLNFTISPNESTSVLKISGNQFKWTFSKEDYTKIRYLNVSNNQFENTSAILGGANTKLETIDMSNSYVGELNESTFKTFVNLRKLILSRTNLSNFQFATFYHQRKLEVLDISYNALNEVDFHLFLRNFQNLVWLNLEGNNLTEIDTITRTYFPKLSVLGISKNNFSCEYLVKFLHPWHDLKLIDNPSNQIHIDGVDCLHGNSNPKMDVVTENNQTVIKQPDRPVDNRNEHLNSSYSNQKESFTIKTLLVLILIVLVIVSMFLIASKCKRPLKIMKEKIINRGSEDHHVAYNQNNVDINQGLL